MPLCQLVLPNELKAKGITLDRAKLLCSQIHDILREILDVSDPDDRSSMITFSGTALEIKFRISFTMGDYEYPGFPKESFRPTVEQIRLAASAIQSHISLACGVAAFGEVEAWENSTFITREKINSLGLTPEASSSTNRLVDSLIIQIVRTKLGDPTISYRTGGEREAPRDIFSYADMPDNVKRMLIDRGQCTESAFIWSEFQYCDYTDCDTSITLDVFLPPGVALSSREQLQIAVEINDILLTNKYTRTGSAEFWIRGKEPAINITV